MRGLITSVALCAALSSCNNTEKPAGSASAAGSANTAGSASTAGNASTAANVSRPAVVTDAHVALANKLVAALEKMGAGISAAGTDCPKVAAAIEASSKDLEPIKGEAAKLQRLGENDAEVKTWFEATYVSKFNTALSPLMAATKACGTDKAFLAAMAKADLGN